MTSQAHLDVLDILATLQPLTAEELDAVILLRQFEAEPPTPAQLVALQGRLEAAVESLEMIAGASKRMGDLCLKLRPTAVARLPLGF